MASSLVVLSVPLGVAVVMFGVGLSLRPDDFARIVRRPRVAIVALACQILLLPVICFGLIRVFGLSGPLAVGMFLLAASPGGPMANVFSYLAGGEVALNITLTAVNSVLAAFTLPLAIGLAVRLFLEGQAQIGIQPAKMIQVLAIVLIPVACGMAARRRSPAWADRMARPVKITSMVVVVVIAAAALVTQIDTFRAHFTSLAPVTLTLAVASLAVGYWIPRLIGANQPQATAAAMETGVHNAALAIGIAVAVLGDKVMALPAAIYGFLALVPASLLAFLLSRRAVRQPMADRV